MRLKGKNAWVTGAGSGIGAKIAELFAREGANVAVNDLNRDSAERTAEIVRSLQRKALVVPGDVTDAAAMKKIADTVISTFGQLHILVANAGVAPTVMFKDMTGEQWDRMLKVHLYGTFNCVSPVINHMLSNKHGRIIITTSMSGVNGDAHLVHYSAAKAGQIGFAKGLSREVCSEGVTVNCIAPGLTQTGILGEVDQAVLTKYMPPVGRIGQPEDQAWAAVYLASDEAAFMTGQTLQVAGGSG